MPPPALHLVGNAHLDPVWLWPWQEGFQEAKATFRSALDRLREYPDFVFTSSSAAIYAWIEENAPGLFAEIRHAVRDGRWVIAGGWWIQPDCNVPGGESFVRQALHGQRYFREKFGVTATVGYNPDSFGHHAALPQLLKKSGCSAYVFMRPMPDEMPGLAGRAFRWRGPDGSEVTAFQIPFRYETFDLAVFDDHLRRHAAELARDGRPLMCFFGVGNHGGGPTRAMLDHIAQLQREPGLPPLVFSSPHRFFAALAGADLPVVTTQLKHHASGCYAAHSGVKRWNRRAEHLLLAAEKFAALAAWPAPAPHAADLRHAWEQVLFNQFHDTLGGTCLESAYDEVRDAYGEASAIAARALNHGVQTISWAIDLTAAPGTKPFVVFNPHPWPVRTMVEMEVSQPDLTGAPIRPLPPRDLATGVPVAGRLTDDTDRAVPLQEIASVVTSDFRHRLAFPAELPPLGYRVYRLHAGVPPRRPRPSARATRTTLENRWLRVRFDPRSGNLVELRDKASGLNLVAGPAAQPQFIADPTDTWSHDLRCYARRFRAPKLSAIAVTENGPVRAALRVSTRAGRTRLEQEFRLAADARHLEVRVSVDWHEQHTLLKFAFPVAVRDAVATHEIPYAFILRPATGEEESIQNWVDVTGAHRRGGRGCGLTLLNDAKGSVDVAGATIRLTALRSPIYAHHDPVKPRRGAHHFFQDQGPQVFAYALLAHVGALDPARVTRLGLEFNQPPVLQFESDHAGPRPRCASFAAAEPANIALTVLKPAHAGAGVVVRAYETAGRRAAALLRLAFAGREVRATFGPHEIKTFLVPADPARPVVETNLLEDPVV